MPPLGFAIPAVIAAWVLAFEIPRFIWLVRRDPGANDFRLSYVAAQVGLKWGWSHMYDTDRLQQLSLAFGTAEGAVSTSFTYVNPPLLAWLVVPLTVLPLPAAFYFWTAINIGALVAAWRLAVPGSRFARATVLIGSISIWPTLYSLERGQPVLLTYGLAIGCWWMASRRREVPAGILLGLAWALKPQDVALLPVVLVICGHRRAAAWWLGSTAALWAVFAVVIGPTGIGTFLGVLSWTAADPLHTANTVAILIGRGTPLLLFQAGFAAAALAGAWRQRRSWDIAFAIGLTGTVMSAVHLHEYDYVGLVVAAWLALREPTPAAELVWLAIGVICAQALSIDDPLPMVLWPLVWLMMLSLRGSSIAKVRDRLFRSEIPADKPANSAYLQAQRQLPVPGWGGPQRRR